MADSHREEIAKLEALYAGNPGGRVFVHLAEAYRKAGEHERARRILDEGLARHSDSASGYVVLGRVLADMQIVEEAEAAFRRVLELDGGNLVALRWLGDLARQSGRGHEAVAHYRDLLARNPSNEEVRDLVEIVEREAAGAPAAASTDMGLEPEWNEPVDEPVPQTDDTADGALSPLSAAPGQTGDAEPAEVELAEVDLAIIDLSAGESPTDAPGDEVPADRTRDLVDEASLEIMDSFESAQPESADDTAVVEVWPTEEEGVEELSTLARNDEADELDIHLLDPSWSGDEPENGEFADDEFLADLMTAGGEEHEPDELVADQVDLMGSTSPLTLQGDEAEPSAPPAEEATPWSSGVRDALDSLAAEFGADDDIGAEADESTELADVAGSAPEPAGAASGEAGHDLGLVTETMAELYRSQGFHERAAEVYRALLRQRPYDLKLSAKLSETEADIAAAAAERAAAASASASAPDDDAGEVWMRGVGSTWDAGAATDAAQESPYAWTPEPDDQPGGAPIGSYLRDLVSWKTAAQRWAATPPPPPPSPPSWSGETDPWGAGSTGEPWGVTDDAISADPWGAPVPDETVPGAPSGEAGTEAEPDSVTEPASPWDSAPADPVSETGPAPDALPAEPWLQGAVEAPADPWGGAQGTADDTPWSPVPEPEAEPAAAAPPPAAAPENEEDSEDEDLEMFRSWLQSLKK